MTGVHALLARNLKKYRRARGLSQAALAEKINCSTTFIGNIEIEKRFPSSRNLDRIAGALGVKPAYLFADGDDLDVLAMLEDRAKRKARLERDVLEAVSRAFDGGG